jgi:hypothetical protein
MSGTPQSNRGDGRRGPDGAEQQDVDALSSKYVQAVGICRRQEAEIKALQVCERIFILGPFSANSIFSPAEWPHGR